MTDKPLTPGEQALTQIGSLGTNIPAFAQELLTALNMRKVMEGVVGDVVAGKGYRVGPSSTLAETPSTPSPTRATNGWADEVPLRSPAAQDIIELAELFIHWQAFGTTTLTNAALPHGPANPLSRKPEEKEE